MPVMKQFTEPVGVSMGAPAPMECKSQDMMYTASDASYMQYGQHAAAQYGACANSQMQVMMMPVFVPVPCYMPSSTATGVEMEVEQLAPEDTLRSAEARFAELPREETSVKNTFITIEAPAAKRRSSCPANVLRLRHARTTVMLANLPNRATEVKVRAHIEELGAKVTELEVAVDKRTGVNRGYAFLKFGDEAEAVEFITLVEGTQLQGSQSKKRLTAAFAKRPHQVKPLAGSQCVKWASERQC